jgi:hypothetical protein
MKSIVEFSNQHRLSVYSVISSFSADNEEIEDVVAKVTAQEIDGLWSAEHYREAFEIMLAGKSSVKTLINKYGQEIMREVMDPTNRDLTIVTLKKIF